MSTTDNGQPTTFLQSLTDAKRLFARARACFDEARAASEPGDAAALNDLGEMYLDVAAWFARRAVAA